MTVLYHLCRSEKNATVLDDVLRFYALWHYKYSYLIKAYLYNIVVS